MSRIEYFGLAGASGVGKGYVRRAFLDAFPNQFVESVVVTTRAQRPSDGSDRLCVNTRSFQGMVNKNEVLFEHQPFGDGGDWYGYLASSLIQGDKRLFVEPHVTKIPDFRQMYGDSLLLLGIISDERFLRINLANRGEKDIESRVAAASEVAKTLKKYRVNMVDELIYITHETRRVIADFVIMFAGTWMGL